MRRGSGECASWGFLGQNDDRFIAGSDAASSLRGCRTIRTVQNGRNSVLIAHLIERSLPPRLRLSDGGWLRRMMHYEGTPQRQLLKELHGTCPPRREVPRRVIRLRRRAAAQGETELTMHIETINAVLREWFGRKNAA